MKLYKKDNKGAMRVWEISAVEDGIIMVYGQLGGSMQEKFEEVTHGKAGRSYREQVESRLQSRINKQIDKGYSYTLEEAKNGTTNSLGLLKPMLAQPIKRVKDIDFNGAFIQAKYDGHRCLITKHDGDIIAYSRNGKVTDSIEHITSELNLAEGETLDGELYIHGEKLQAISSLVRRKQERSMELKFHCYDLISDDPYSKRYTNLYEVVNSKENSMAVPTKIITSASEAYRAFRNLRSRGYEGAIVRQNKYGYEDDKRSKSLIKIKECFDEEFYVVDIVPSKDGWARLELLTTGGDTFMVSAPGSMEDKHYVMDNMQEYLGRYVTVEYSELTKDGIPFHPIATQWRNKRNE